MWDDNICSTTYDKAAAFDRDPGVDNLHPDGHLGQAYFRYVCTYWANFSCRRTHACGLRERDFVVITFKHTVSS